MDSVRACGEEQVACPAGRHTRFPRDTQHLLLSPGGCGGWRETALDGPDGISAIVADV
jgi:hypothetical protein